MTKIFQFKENCAYFVNVYKRSTARCEQSDAVQQQQTA